MNNDNIYSIQANTMTTKTFSLHKVYHLTGQLKNVYIGIY